VVVRREIEKVSYYTSERGQKKKSQEKREVSSFRGKIEKRKFKPVKAGLSLKIGQLIN